MTTLILEVQRVNNSIYSLFLEICYHLTNLKKKKIRLGVPTTLVLRRLRQEGSEFGLAWASDRVPGHSELHGKTLY